MACAFRHTAFLIIQGWGDSERIRYMENRSWHNGDEQVFEQVLVLHFSLFRAGKAYFQKLAQDNFD